MFDKKIKDFTLVSEVNDPNNYSLVVLRGDKRFKINFKFIAYTSRIDTDIRILNDDGGWKFIGDADVIFPKSEHEDVYCSIYAERSKKERFLNAYLKAAIEYIRKLYTIDKNTETKVSKIDFREVVKSLKKSKSVSKYISDIYYSNHNNSLIVTFIVPTKDDIDKLQKKLLSNKYKDHVVDILTNSDLKFAFIYE